MLNIFYRLCEKETATHCDQRPEWFSKKKCLKSFINAMENAGVDNNVFFVHDGPEGELYKLIEGYNVRSEEHTSELQSH